MDCLISYKNYCLAFYCSSRILFNINSSAINKRSIVFKQIFPIKSIITHLCEINGSSVVSFIIFKCRLFINIFKISLILCTKINCSTFLYCSAMLNNQIINSKIIKSAWINSPSIFCNAVNYFYILDCNIIMIWKSKCSSLISWAVKKQGLA